MRSLFDLPRSGRLALLVIILWWPIALSIVAVVALYNAVTQLGMQRELPQRKGLFIVLVAVAVAAGWAMFMLQSVALQRGAADVASVAAAIDWLGVALFVALGTVAVLGVRRIVSRRRTMTVEEHHRYYAAPGDKPEWLYWPGRPVPPREPQRVRDLRAYRFYEQRPKTAIAVAAGGAVLLMTAGSLSVAAVPTWAQDAVVVRVVDGDTVDVRIDGAEERVRILNMNAPENNAVTGESECLGPEATAALQEFLPAGSTVRLAYDDVRRDRYGRLLAKVTTRDDVSAAVLLIGQGLAVPAEHGDNLRYLAESSRAVGDAEAARAGIFSSDVDCSPVATIEALRSRAASVASPAVEQPSAELASTESAAIAVLSTIAATTAAAKAVEWVTPDIRDRWLRDVARIERSMTTARDDAAAFAQRAGAREARAEAAAREAEAERVAAEAARQAEAQRQAEGEATARESEPAESGSSGGGSNSTGGSTSTGGYDGYTGCRAYGPGGTSIDEQGRRYTKIDCTTKLPL